jgi:hypothetical protein
MCISNNITEKVFEQNEKENYIANMLVRTLYSNDVENAECYRIIKLFKDKVLGSDIEI